MGPVSLRLGHASALMCHWHIIHSRGAAPLPPLAPQLLCRIKQQQSIDSFFRKGE